MASPLRQQLIEDLQLHGLSPRSQEMYVVAVRQLAEHYRKSPDQISEAELRAYFLYLKNIKKISPSTLTFALCGIKFFLESTLQCQWATLELVRPDREKKLPLSKPSMTWWVACGRRTGRHIPQVRACLSTEVCWTHPF